jgi:predicted DNA-binding transcriptional regulator AlpA
MNTDTTTIPTARRARRVHTFELPQDYPAAKHKLGGTDLFRAVLGVGASTFARYLADGLLPAPIKIGMLNRWTFETIERVATEGFKAA